MYFATPCVPAHQAMLDHVLGWADTPAQRNRRPPGVLWCADNGAFTNVFNETRWWNWLQTNAPDAALCAFATAPDVVGDAAATLTRSTPWLARIRELGYPAAFVAQDGFDDIEVPWDDFDVLFLGGTNAFKLTAPGVRAARQAHRHGKWLHVGRVNSLLRMRFAESIGAQSVDGTYLKHGPDKNLPKLLGWLAELHARPAMFPLMGPT